MLEIDLNADVGEGYGVYTFGADEALLGVISSANIACGFHAGDPHHMRVTVDSCIKRGVAIGAHPGLPDRIGFGRREWIITPNEASDYVLYQVGALQAFVHAAGGHLHHVKLHGALYHMSSTNRMLAEAIVKCLMKLDSALLLYGPGRSCLHDAANQHGMGYVSEGFVDRAYLPDGSLAPRHQADAVLHDTAQIVNQAYQIAVEGSVIAVDGSKLEVDVQTICLHGDTPNAVKHATHIYKALKQIGIIIRAK